jgi:hypothetical protein
MQNGDNTKMPPLPDDITDYYRNHPLALHVTSPEDMRSGCNECGAPFGHYGWCARMGGSGVRPTSLTAPPNAANVLARAYLDEIVNPSARDRYHMRGMGVAYEE